VHDITNPKSKLRNTISFQLQINTFYLSTFSSADWINILTHELGHALGIGIFWNNSELSPPIQNNFLDGSQYPLSQAAYNQITSSSRTKIPLETSGGIGTASSHWEDNLRIQDSVTYFGLIDELMVGYYNAGMRVKLSQLSIKTLVQHGYEEINPGRSEGTPTINNGFNFFQSLNKKYKYSCNNNFDTISIQSINNKQ
jgi:hypothetical protein